MQRLEVEFAFILARPLEGPRVTLLDVLNATDYVVPGLLRIEAARRPLRVDGDNSTSPWPEC